MRETVRAASPPTGQFWHPALCQVEVLMGEYGGGGGGGTEC